MPKGKRYSPEQIITKLRQAELLLSQGKSVEEAAKPSVTGSNPECLRVIFEHGRNPVAGQAIWILWVVLKTVKV